MRIRIVLVALVVALGSTIWAAGFYTDFLWFENLGYGAVFWNIILSQWAVRLAAGIIFFLFLYVNLLFTRRALLSSLNLNLREKIFGTHLGSLLTKRGLTLFFLAGSLFLAFFFSSYTGELWLQVRQFLQGVEFGLSEPIFNKDVSFYVFRLPLWRSLYVFSQTLVIITILVVSMLYLLTNPPVQVGRKVLFFPYQGRRHIFFLLSLAFLLKAGDYLLQMYGLLFSPRGVTFGPGYADLHANLPALWVLFFLALAAGGLLIFNIFQFRARLIYISSGVLIGASLLVGGIYPSFVQQFRVDPNELALERPYIENNIKFTRRAYALDKVRVEHYPVRRELDFDDLQAAGGTIENIRLWDYRPLGQTINQLQGIRPYYKFRDVDTDRYYLDEQYKQVMLSARELDPEELAVQARTWINLRLQYTHGYGLAMTPVARVTEQGLPEFIVQDIPPVLGGGLELKRPEIYYGEMGSDYVLVNTNTPEFNYPLGDTNVYTHYEGRGGVQLNSIGKKLLYALKFSDHRLFLSGELTRESRIMFNRRIPERVEKIAPFLRYDGDPYLVLAEGKLFWLLDAYTTTDMFPYAEPFAGLNYIRNSVKVVIDAYDGTVDFYITDPADPLLLTYARIFPGLFKPLESMPEGLVPHLRYPETYLALQARVYATYHMLDPVVFYNREDFWQIPNEKYDGEYQPVEPYYTILELPGSEQPEFALVLPFTPSRKDNMIAWMAGRCDGENYGELLVYLFPKERVIFGPMQIETRIDQNTLISQQLTLWDQRGSRVIRGNLLVLPLREAILYVEPVFIQAEKSELPALARVIVSFEDRVVMEPTLEEALVAIFGSGEQAGAPPPADGLEPEPERPDEIEELQPEIPDGSVPELARRAQELLQEAQENQRNGDWAGYGRSLQELEKTLTELVQSSTDADS
jgi:uncharacterized membrane protein (UPF0182 family)